MFTRKRKSKEYRKYKRWNRRQNLNSLNLLRQSEYKYMDELNKDIMSSLLHYSSCKKYISIKHNVKVVIHIK